MRKVRCGAFLSLPLALALVLRLPVHRGRAWVSPRRSPGSCNQPRTTWQRTPTAGSNNAGRGAAARSRCRVSEPEVEEPAELGTASVGSSLLLPLGPLCPFRSDFWGGGQLDVYADAMEGKQRIIAALMMRIQTGERLARDEEIQLCKEMKESNEMWRVTNMRLRYAEDFQGVESFKMVEANLKRQGLSMDMVEALTIWQPQHMEATFERRPPPPMPAPLDPGLIQRVSQSMPSVMGVLGSPSGISSPPFLPGSDAVDSPVVRDEFEALMKNHEQLITFGKGYRSFDPRGKEMFLDQLALIGDRWNVFIARFKLMGRLNPAYVTESEEWLQRVGFSVADYHAVLDEAHALMREEAVQEGLQR